MGDVDFLHLANVGRGLPGRHILTVKIADERNVRIGTRRAQSCLLPARLNVQVVRHVVFRCQQHGRLVVGGQVDDIG